MIQSNNPKHPLIHLNVDSKHFLSGKAVILGDRYYYESDPGEDPILMWVSAFTVDPGNSEFDYNRERLFQKAIDDLSKEATRVEPNRVMYMHVVTFSDRPTMMAAGMNFRPMALIPADDPIVTETEQRQKELQGITDGARVRLIHDYSDDGFSLKIGHEGTVEHAGDKYSVVDFGMKLSTPNEYLEGVAIATPPKPEGRPELGEGEAYVIAVPKYIFETRRHFIIGLGLNLVRNKLGERISLEWVQLDETGRVRFGFVKGKQ